MRQIFSQHVDCCWHEDLTAAWLGYLQSTRWQSLRWMPCVPHRKGLRLYQQRHWLWWRHNTKRLSANYWTFNLWGESAGADVFCSKRSDSVQLWCFLCYHFEQSLKQTAVLPLIWDALGLMWLHQWRLMDFKAFNNGTAVGTTIYPF